MSSESGFPTPATAINRLVAAHHADASANQAATCVSTKLKRNGRGQGTPRTIRQMVKAIATAARDAGPETRKELVRILKESYDAIIGDAEIEQAEVEPEVRGKFGIKKLGMEAFVRKWLEARSLDPKNLTPDQNAKLKAAWAKYNGE